MGEDDEGVEGSGGGEVRSRMSRVRVRPMGIYLEGQKMSAVRS